MIRIHLLSPKGLLVTPETYNKLFTMHGVVMVFFFLVPSIPATLGNFLVPMMIGARDLAFPRLNLLSWYVYITGAAFTLYALAGNGFRPPQATELYRLQSGQNVADLDSEEVTSYEIGGRGSVSTFDYSTAIADSSRWSCSPSRSA